jgi:diguanylate cyclase (GGDEF)-like protein
MTMPVMELAHGHFDALRIAKVLGRILELNGLRADGTEFPVELSASSWSADQQTFFTAIVRDVSERKRLEASVLELARTDHLTGLLNRRAGQEQVDREIARSHRSRHALGFVLLDIDHFKQINDSAGHAGGDRVLQQLGALLRARIRATDIALRWGGEEFLVVLPDTDEGGARVLAEALRRHVEATRFEVVAQITVSLGVSALMEGELSDQAVARADSKLYSAKRKGRNCVGA